MEIKKPICKNVIKESNMLSKLEKGDLLLLQNKDSSFMGIVLNDDTNNDRLYILCDNLPPISLDNYLDNLLDMRRMLYSKYLNGIENSNKNWYDIIAIRKYNSEKKCTIWDYIRINANEWEDIVEC